MGFLITQAWGLDQVRPTAAEVDSPMPGDALLPRPDAVMDRAFTLRAPPEDVWPWLVQLGKHRAGWYMTHRVERFVPRARRASRHVDQRWQHLVVGSVIPDYGGRDETFTVAEIDPPHALVHTSRRGRMEVTWAITVAPLDPGPRGSACDCDRDPSRGSGRVAIAGEAIDLVTISWLARRLSPRAGGTWVVSGSRQGPAHLAYRPKDRRDRADRPGGVRPPEPRRPPPSTAIVDLPILTTTTEPTMSDTSTHHRHTGRPADPGASQARRSVDELHVPVRLRGHPRLLHPRRRRRHPRRQGLRVRPLPDLLDHGAGRPGRPDVHGRAVDDAAGQGEPHHEPRRGLALVPVTVFNVAGGFCLYFYGLGVALELVVLALIVRFAWTWPRTAPSATARAWRPARTVKPSRAPAIGARGGTR